jgi:hypothetical protein
MLAGQTRGNYERIGTWRGTYEIRSRQPAPSGVASAAVKLVPSKMESAPLAQEFDYSVDFVIDIGSGSLYESKNSSRMAFLKGGSNEPIKVPNSMPVDGRWILTAEHYVHFDPRFVFPRFVFLPDHPEAQQKRAAFCEGGERVRNARLGDILDPRHFYRVDPRSYFWDEVTAHAQALRGGLGAKFLSMGQERLKLSKSVGAGGTWYRVKCLYLKGPTVVSYWSSTVGFNPVLRLSSADQAGNTPLSKTEWQWKSVDGIYIPAKVRELLYSDSQPGQVTHTRDATMQECILNSPIGPHQFDFEGLGMKNGDLVIDHIVRSVYKLQDGKPVKLGDFQDRHRLGSSSWGTWPRGRLILAGNLSAFALFAFFYRRAKRLKGKSVP